MLVLTRRTGESIIIGNGIRLTVVNVGPGRVKLGVEAPPSVRVDREEVHARVQREKADEKSTDVLAAVSEVLGHADHATTVSGPDTGVLSNANSAAPAQDDASAPKLSDYRRKPR